MNDTAVVFVLVQGVKDANEPQKVILLSVTAELFELKVSRRSPVVDVVVH
jgi:hypothetical protein